MIANSIKMQKNKIIILGSVLITMIIFSQNILFLSEAIFRNTIVFKVLFVVGGFLSLLLFRNRISIKSIFLVVVILLFFFITYIFNNNSSLEEKFYSFILYAIPAICYSNCKFETKTIFKLGIILGYLWLIIYIFINGLIEVNSFSFGYCLLPLCLSSFLYFDSETKKCKRFIGFSSFILSSILLIVYGSRGPVMCLVLFFFIYLIPKLKNTWHKFLFATGLLLFCLVLINFEDILVFLHNSLPIKIAFIEKSYTLLMNSSSGVSNGRNDIVAEIFSEYSFVDFVLGSGIGSYGSKHSINGYTHNIFLSVLLDFGVIGVIFILSLCIGFIKRIYKERNNFSIFLFSVSILILLFSGEYWEMYSFWLFTFISLNQYKRSKYD